MPIFQIENRTPGLDEAIDDLLTELKSLTGDDPAYEKTVTQLKTLHELKQNEKPDYVKPDTLITVLANVAIAVMVLTYEKENVVTTKLQSFLSKAK